MDKIQIEMKTGFPQDCKSWVAGCVEIHRGFFQNPSEAKKRFCVVAGCVETRRRFLL